MYATDTPIRPQQGCLKVLLPAMRKRRCHRILRRTLIPPPLEIVFRDVPRDILAHKHGPNAPQQHAFRASYELFLLERDGRPIKACMGREKVCMCVRVCVWLRAVVKILIMYS